MITFKEVIAKWNTYVNYVPTVSPYVFMYKHSDKVVALFNARDIGEFYGPKALEHALLSAHKLSDKEVAEEGSTKACPECGNTKLVLLRTHNLKACNRCGHKMQWLLEDGQSSIQ